jgi:hypothetical protein
MFFGEKHRRLARLSIVAIGISLAEHRLFLHHRQACSSAQVTDGNLEGKMCETDVIPIFYMIKMLSTILSFE